MKSIWVESGVGAKSKRYCWILDDEPFLVHLNREADPRGIWIFRIDFHDREIVSILQRPAGSMQYEISQCAPISTTNRKDRIPRIVWVGGKVPTRFKETK